MKAFVLRSSEGEGLLSEGAVSFVLLELPHPMRAPQAISIASSKEAARNASRPSDGVASYLAQTAIASTLQVLAPPGIRSRTANQASP